MTGSTSAEWRSLDLLLLGVLGIGHNIIEPLMVWLHILDGNFLMRSNWWSNIAPAVSSFVSRTDIDGGDVAASARNCLRRILIMVERLSAPLS